jgi:hypothetical protein
VWLATDAMGTYRAVKVVRRDRFDDQRPFEREYEGLRRFEPLSRRHPGWVPILQIGPNPIDDYFYYVLEAADDMTSGRAIVPDRYVPRTLARELAVRGRLPVDECLQLGLTLVEALGELHKAGLVHRDVKPSNIIFIENFPKLADSGLVTDLTGGTKLIGSEAYMPPDHQSCPSADLYSLAKVLYEVCMGKPFPEAPTALGKTGKPDRLRKLNEIILKACDRKPEKRFQSARPMWERLAELQPARGPAPARRPKQAHEPKQAMLELEAEGGAVPLNSTFYLRRPADDEFEAALARGDSLILIKGARQMGKTSLLARGLDQARQLGSAVISTDLQLLNDADFETLEKFYLALGNSLDPAQLKVDALLSDLWDSRLSPNTNFDRYLRHGILGKLTTRVFWGLDEVDRLFTCRFGEEVFRMLRSWHNKRALDPQGPWSQLTLAIAHATEASLFITDMNNSPFNVGTRLILEDFTLEQVAELNRRYGSPLKGRAEVEELISLVGGQPFLVRVALSELSTHRVSRAEVAANADRDDGIFGDHLRRLRAALSRDKNMVEVVRAILGGQESIDSTAFYRLRSAGLLAGTSERSAQLRCQLYVNYFRRHLS